MNSTAPMKRYWRSACTNRKPLVLILASMLIIYVWLWRPLVREGRVSFIESEILRGNYFAWCQGSGWIADGVLTKGERARLETAASTYCNNHESVTARYQVWRGKSNSMISDAIDYCHLDSLVDGGLPFKKMLYPAFHDWPSKFFVRLTQDSKTRSDDRRGGPG